jgi:MFS superfamily sulfate permease-like transporter
MEGGGIGSLIIEQLPLLLLAGVMFIVAVKIFK